MAYADQKLIEEEFRAKSYLDNRISESNTKVFNFCNNLFF